VISNRRQLLPFIRRNSRETPQTTIPSREQAESKPQDKAGDVANGWTGGVGAHNENPVSGHPLNYEL